MILASVVCQLMAHKLQYTCFLLELSDLGCELEIAPLRDCAREILRCVPAGKMLAMIHLLSMM